MRLPGLNTETATASAAAPPVSLTAGTLSVAAAEARAILLNVGAAGAAGYTGAISRSVTVLAAGSVVATYPRAVGGTDNAALYSFRLDGLTPETTYTIRVSWTAGTATATASIVQATGAEAETPPSPILASPALLIDERCPRVAIPLEMPATPAISGIAQVENTDTTFVVDLSGGTAPLEVAGTLNEGVDTEPWHFQSGDATPVDGDGGLKGSFWANPIFGVSGVLMVSVQDAYASIAKAGDKVFHSDIANPIDLSNVSVLTLHALSAGPFDRKGQPVNFCWSEDNGPNPANWSTAPITISAAEKWLYVNVELGEGSRTAVRHWGFSSAGSTQYRLAVDSITSASGVYGERAYKVVRRTEYAVGDEPILTLDSIASTEATAAGAVKGVSNTLSFAALPADQAAGDIAPAITHTALVYGKDADMADYHFIGQATAGASTFSDTTLDISGGVTLREVKCQVPHAGDCVGQHHGRLAIARGADLWLSAIGDITSFADAGIGEAEDLGLLEVDGIRLPLSEAGTAQAIAGLGVYNGSDFVGDTLILCSGACVYLKGTTYRNFDMGYRLPVGVAGPEGWTRDNAGNLFLVTPEGNVGMVGRDLNLKDMSDAIAPALWAIDEASRHDWVMGYDPQHGRLLLFTGSGAYCHDSGWIAMSDTPAAFTAATGTDNHGQWLQVGTPSGETVRMFADPSHPTGWAWRSREVSGVELKAPGAAIVLTRLNVEAPQPVTVKVYADGALMETATVRPGLPYRLYRHGRRFSFGFEASGTLTAAHATFSVRGG